MSSGETYQLLRSILEEANCVIVYTNDPKRFAEEYGEDLSLSYSGNEHLLYVETIQDLRDFQKAWKKNKIVIVVDDFNVIRGTFLARNYPIVFRMYEEMYGGLTAGEMKIINKLNLDLNAYRTRKFAVYGLNAKVSDRNFLHFGGYKDVKDFLTTNIVTPLKKVEQAVSYGVFPRGLLVFGPPGVGKTYLSQIVSGESNVPYLMFDLGLLNAEDLDRSLTEFFRIVDTMAPLILVLDMAENVLPHRGKLTVGGVMGRVVNRFLTWMADENRKVMVFLTTNSPGNLDPASIRGGRIDYAFPLDYPDVDSRSEIFDVHLFRIPKNLKIGSDVNVEKLANMTDHYTGADIASLVRYATLRAMRENREVTMADFEAIMKEVQINVRERESWKDRIVREVKEQPGIPIVSSLFAKF